MFLSLDNFFIHHTIEDMKSEKKFALSRPFFTVLCPLIFALCIIYVPSGFAQAVQSSAAAKDARNRQYLELLNSVYTFALDNYVVEIDSRVLYEGALKGMMDAFGDPYTVYLDMPQMRELNDTTAGSFGGVGLHITKPIESTVEKPAYVEVVSPMEDTPGWKAGIQAGDLIISIDGTSTADISMNEVLKILRGEKGSTVNLVIRRGKTSEFPVSLVRALIEVPTVKYGMITDKKQKTGYLKIIEFTPKTAERVQNALDSFKEAGFTSLIIDLRNNPGGLITSAADVADKFIDKGVIVSTKSRLMFENSVYRASEKATVMPKDIPIIVLINRGSASASEIVAGALKDYHLAYLVGEKTYGKGSVQQVVPLPNSDGIKLTMARYYTPSDSNIDKVGIPPDTQVLFPALTEEEEKIFASLVTDGVISKYVEAHPHMSDNDIVLYAQRLADTYKLEERVLRRLVKMEVNRTKPADLYDLDYDVQLKAALKMFNNSDFGSLVKSAKTLKELQAVSVAGTGKTPAAAKN